MLEVSHGVLSYAFAQCLEATPIQSHRQLHAALQAKASKRKAESYDELQTRKEIASIA